MTLTPERFATVRRLFEAALDHPPEQREAFLLTATPDDPTLREEVRTLLEAHHRPGDRTLSRPAAEQVGLDRPVAAPSLLGRDLGAYRVTREIGRGGMGTVYEAVRADAQFTKRVAIKTLRADTDSATVLRRFRREREIQATLAHPNIATLLDAGLTEDGIPYIVLEYVDGMPIDTYCERRRLPLSARLDLFRQVIQAVQHAHRQLVVHRDLKPSNILVTDDGTVKLLDFGISKLLSETASHTTTDGGAAFTTAFASPEQIGGAAISTATDVYSLGTILFHLLAGRHPFNLDDESPVAAWTTICREPPPSPSAVATAAAAAGMGFGTVERLRKALRGELDAIVLMALRKEPDRRYLTAAAFGDDLLNHLKGLPVQARPDSAGYRLGKFVARNRGATVAATLAVFAMGAGTTLALWQAHAARAHAAAADQQRRTAEQVSAFLQGIFASADASWRGQGEQLGPTTTVLEVVDAAAERVDRDLATEPAVREALFRILGSIYLALQQSAKGEARMHDVLRLQRARNAAPAELAVTLTELSGHHYVAGRFDSSMTLAHESRVLLEGAGATDSEAYGLTLHQLGLTLWAQGRLAEAEPYMDRAVAIRRARFGDDAATAIGLGNLGILRDAQGNLDAAQRYLREADAIFTGFEDHEYFEHGVTLANLGRTLLLMDELVEAETVTQRGLDILERTLGTDNLFVGLTLFNLARIQLRTGRESLALATHHRGVERLRPLPPTHPDMARAATYEAAILLALGRLADAEQLARQALAARLDAYIAGDWRTAETRGILGQILRARGQAAEAEEQLRQSFDDLRAALGANDPRTREVEQALTQGR